MSLPADRTVREALRAGRKLLAGQQSLARGETPELDAEVLLREVLGLTRSALYTHPERRLTMEEQAHYCKLLGRRARGEPVAYLTGRREFMGLDFHVDARVLIPRPETELLVERALELLQPGPSKQFEVRRLKLPTDPSLRTSNLEPRTSNWPLSPEGGGGDGRRAAAPATDVGRRGGLAGAVLVADVGTGSGAIAVSLAALAGEGVGAGVRVYATDVSAGALTVARANAARLLGTKQARVAFVRCHLLDAVRGPLGLIVANLPYIPTGELATLPPAVRQYEPWSALDGGPDGLDAYRALLQDASGKLLPGGALLMECDPRQAETLRGLAGAALPGAETAIHGDLAGRERIVEARTPM
ncbi:MAG: N5-glutamine methyltransferase family protein [Chloroflexota bacterium]